MLNCNHRQNSLTKYYNKKSIHRYGGSASALQAKKSIELNSEIIYFQYIVLSPLYLIQYTFSMNKCR